MVQYLFPEYSGDDSEEDDDDEDKGDEENDEDDNNSKRYEPRQKKAVVRYHAPLDGWSFLHLNPNVLLLFTELEPSEKCSP